MDIVGTLWSIYVVGNLSTFSKLFNHQFQSISSKSAFHHSHPTFEKKKREKCNGCQHRSLAQLPYPKSDTTYSMKKPFWFENSMLENRIHQNIAKDTLFSFKNIYSLKNIFNSKKFNFSENNVINVNVSKATKVLCSVFVLVNFRIQMTKKKSLCNRYKGFFLQKKWYKVVTLWRKNNLKLPYLYHRFYHVIKT